ncbi:MAG TPA: 4-(cytidine 5'-diphospho)-2-C-methyl-D-erythritol kinase, partial [Thermohalobaculum sp.]|nr:4-(cytidine 5'-diphospho)-2-C-methyl-D-erythritol kinase [Thermohalobaculum sp.]
MAARALAEAAPAKVNLYLHVTGRRADGYHLIDSLAVFPGVGDRLSARPAGALTLRLGGPFAGALAAGADRTGPDNLVLRAARALAAAHGIAPAAELSLVKRLPPAAGIGGGSADAAAALRLLARLWQVSVPEGLAETLGADVPVCLGAPAPRCMAGIGERLAPPPALPGFWLVLANPGAAVSTAAVFAALERRDSAPAPPPPRLADFAALVHWLAPLRNDLEPAARALCPPLHEVLAALADAPLARMSGSGATCFALHQGAAAARAQAAHLRRARPGWWVAAAPVAPVAPV